MVAYATHELVPSSKFAKQFGSYLSQIQNSVVDKLAILKNNKVEAVLISKDEYEKMQMAIDALEDKELINIVEQRLSKPYKTLSQEEMLKSLNIDKSELQ